MSTLFELQCKYKLEMFQLLIIYLVKLTTSIKHNNMNNIIIIYIFLGNIRVYYELIKIFKYKIRLQIVELNL